MRASDAFIPALSLVYEEHDSIVGHLLLSKIEIVHAGGSCHQALARLP
ncbi:hypothetical protein [Brevibacillus parabrevis]|nr:hypothetical protein [Brevibacillus parabrevis]